MQPIISGKGGGISVEIETSILLNIATNNGIVERVEASQSRLKPIKRMTTAYYRQVERVEASQSRLKHGAWDGGYSSNYLRGKGGGISVEIET